MLNEANNHQGLGDDTRGEGDRVRESHKIGNKT